MRIGISVAQCDRLARPAAVVAAVKAAEQLGYSSVWVCDSALDPAGVLSAAAAVTSRVGLGAAIFVGDGEDPVSLARALATVDVLSEGRLTVAIGLRPEAHERALDPVLDALSLDEALDGYARIAEAAELRAAQRPSPFVSAQLPQR